jgi:hypothetical protein
VEPAQPQPPQSIDATGLSDEAIRAVALFVAQLRGQGAPGIPAPFRSRQEWADAVRQGAESHKPPERPADWGRESIDAGRGE